MKQFLPALIFLAASSARATTFIETPFPDLVKDAPTIVRGVIGESHADWVTGEDASKRIYTFYQLDVKEAFKGDVFGKSITIREMGGEKNGIGMQVAGAAQFARGEDVVIFLGERNRDGTYDVRGLSSGKFDLKRQEDGKICLSGLGMAHAESDGLVHGDEHAGAAGDCTWSLDSLRQLVHKQGDALATAAPAVKTPSVTPTRQPSIAAPQLQPSIPEESRSDARGQLWIVVLALGLVGLFAVLLMKSRQ